VNQARFAVSAMRRLSLTRPAGAGLFQASASQQTIPHPGTGLLPLHFLEMLCKPIQRPSFRPSAGDETTRALSRAEAAGLRNL